MPSGFLRNGAIVVAATVAGVAALSAFLQQPQSMADSIATARPEPARRIVPAATPVATPVSAALPAAQPAPAPSPVPVAMRDPVEPQSSVAHVELPAKPVAVPQPAEKSIAPQPTEKPLAAVQPIEKPVKATVDVPPAQSLELSPPPPAPVVAAAPPPAATEQAEKPATLTKKNAATRKKTRITRHLRDDRYDGPALGYDSTGRPRRMTTRPAPFPIRELFSRRW